MKKIFEFNKKGKAVEERLRRIEEEIGVRERQVQSGYSEYVFGRYPTPLFKIVDNQVGSIVELDKEVNDLRKHLGLEYTATPVHLAKKKTKAKTKTWENKIAEAIGEAINERY